MKNFDWTQFTRKIAIKASMETLYKAWTVTSELEKWFLKDAAFFTSDNKKTDADKPVKKGYRYEWQWHLYSIIEKGEILEANSMDNIQFTFADGCLVEVKLESLEDYVIVSITQSNIPETDHHKINVRLDCDNGWSFYLVNLKSVYEGGLDLRNKDEKLKPMLNN